MRGNDIVNKAIRNKPRTKKKKSDDKYTGKAEPHTSTSYLQYVL